MSLFNTSNVEGGTAVTAAAGGAEVLA